MRCLQLAAAAATLVLLAAEPAAAQPRKYSNAFLNIGVGARGLAMSGAVAASVQDVSAGYWNPANLVDLTADLQVAGMHSEYFAGIANFDYGAIGITRDSSSALALSVIRFGVDGIPNTTQLIDADGNLNYDRITTFSAVDYGFILSYSRHLRPKGLSIGVNVKVIYRQIGDFADSYGFGLDGALTYRRNNWRFAAVARDLTSTYNVWVYSLDDATEAALIATDNELPQDGIEYTLPSLVLAASYTRPIHKFAVSGELNAVITTDQQRNVLFPGEPFSMEPLLGIEGSYLNIIFLRAGIGNIQRIKTFSNTEEISVQPNLGLGLRLGNFNLDYAITNIGQGNGLLYSNVFSLSFSVFKPSTP